MGLTDPSVQLLSCVLLFATPWTAACQASLSFTISWSLLKLMFIESVMPSNHLILCHPLLLPPSIFPSTESFPMSQFFASGGQSIGVTGYYIYKKNNNNKLLYSTRNYIQYPKITYNGKESEKESIHVCIHIYETLCCTPETS